MFGGSIPIFTGQSSILYLKPIILTVKSHQRWCWWAPGRGGSDSACGRSPKKSQVRIDGGGVGWSFSSVSAGYVTNFYLGSQVFSMLGGGCLFFPIWFAIDCTTRHPKEVSKKPILLNILACAGRMTPCHGHFKPWNRSASVALAANLLFDVKHLNLSIQSLHLSKPRGHGTQHVLVIRLLQNHRSSFKAANSTYSITAWLILPNI